MRYLVGGEWGGSIAKGGPRVLVCDGAPEGLSTGLEVADQTRKSNPMMHCLPHDFVNGFSVDGLIFRRNLDRIGDKIRQSATVAKHG